MEMGSSSMTDSGGSSSSSPLNSATESLNGLKFGQKIYFGNVGSAVPPKLAAGSSSSSGATPPKKVRGGAVQSAEPPRCQVEGCLVDLSDAKAYYCRHKVCGMHSKYPKVIVSGLEQRFCQQCSRFHQLPEFDQGKRSCRRRLAGHNERRRKPPPGSLLSPCYGRLSRSIFENSSRSGSFVMDFSTCPTRFAGNKAWPTTRTVEHLSGNQTAASTGKFILHPWQSSSCSSPSDLFLQGPAGGTSYSGIPPGECISGIPESSCALSLLSNQPWGSRNRSPGHMVHHFMNTECPPVAPPTAPHSGTTNHFLTPSWGFKDNETSNNSQELLSNLGLGQISQPLTSQFSSELNVSQQNRRQYMELEHSNDFDSSTQHINWSL